MWSGVAHSADQIRRNTVKKNPRNMMEERHAAVGDGADRSYRAAGRRSDRKWRTVGERLPLQEYVLRDYEMD